MKEDTVELAENKLLLLYIMDKIKLPISNIQLTEIVLENNFLNYFTLQQCLLELSSSNFIKTVEKDEKIRLSITDKGIKILNMFFNKISKNKIAAIDSYLVKHINNIKKQITVTADYTIENQNNFVVNLAAYENDSILINMKLGVPSNKHARDICSKWKEDCSTIYDQIIKILVDEK